MKIEEKKLLSKITLALRKLNDIELQVFDLTFYKCKDEDEIMDIISYGKDKVRYIKKVLVSNSYPLLVLMIGVLNKVSQSGTFFLMH